MRDAALLARSLEQCSHQQRIAALTGARHRVGKAAVDAWLALADSLREGNAPVDPFREAALYRYALAHLAGGAALP